MHPGRLERRIALVGFDDVPLADLLVLGVTLVAQDPARIGQVAARPCSAGSPATGDQRRATWSRRR
jgi:DNA-binding LacI/PurR family transcriptional regulator